MWKLPVCVILAVGVSGLALLTYTYFAGDHVDRGEMNDAISSIFAPPQRSISSQDSRH